MNTPLAELASRLSRRPGDATVAYCRGPHCVMAGTAVTRLRETGHNALRMEGGYPQWRDSGRATTHTA